MHHASGICEWPVTIYLTNSNIYLLQILFYYFHYNTVYSVRCRYTSCNLKQKQGSNCLLSVRRKWFLFIHIVPGKIVDFWNSDFLEKSQLDLPSGWIFFLYLLLCMNFISWHFPLHEVFFLFPPPISFLMVRPLLFILGDPGAVSRVDKTFLVKVYCKIETSSSRSYNKLSPRTFCRPD